MNEQVTARMTTERATSYAVTLPSGTGPLGKFEPLKRRSRGGEPPPWKMDAVQRFQVEQPIVREAVEVPTVQPVPKREAGASAQIPEAMQAPAQQTFLDTAQADAALAPAFRRTKKPDGYWKAVFESIGEGETVTIQGASRRTGLSGHAAKYGQLLGRKFSIHEKVGAMTITRVDHLAQRVKPIVRGRKSKTKLPIDLFLPLGVGESVELECSAYHAACACRWHGKKLGRQFTYELTGLQRYTVRRIA